MLVRVRSGLLLLCDRHGVVLLKCEAAISRWVRVLATTTTRSPSRVWAGFGVNRSAFAGIAHGAFAEVAGAASAYRRFV